jgi:hypothetical protein
MGSEMEKSMNLEKDGWEVGRIRINRIGWEVRYRSYTKLG